MKKTLLVILLVLLVVLTGVSTLFSADTFSVNAEDEAYTVTYLETEADFVNFLTARYTQSANHKFILTSDIYLKRFYDEGKTLNTIKNNKAEFNGIFDGRGHAIVGLQEPFFGSIGESGEVKNVQLIGVNITDTLYAYGLAFNNKGAVSGVELTGTIKGTGASMGLVANNYGRVENCFAVANLGSNENSANDFIIANCVESGTVTESFGYATNKGTATSDEFVLESAGSYAEFNYLLLKGSDFSLNAALNLYNEPFVSVDTNADLTAYQNGMELYNVNSLSYTVNEHSYQANGAENLPEAVVPQGEGTKESPYMINSAGELLYLDNLAQDKYAMLTSSLVLTNYNIENDYLIGTLSCRFDGNGYSITLPTEKYLFDEISALIAWDELSENDTVYSLINVSDLNINASLAKTLNGGIYNVTLKGAGFDENNENITVNLVDTVNENALVMRSTVDSVLGGVASSNNGFIGYTRVYGNGNYVNSNEGNGDMHGIVGAYQEATIDGLSNNFLSLGVEEGVIRVGENQWLSSDIDEDVFPYVSIDNNSNKHLYTDPWSFGTEDEYSWGILDNRTQDDYILVFPSDNITYKSVTRFKEPYSEARDTFGCVSGREQYTVEPLDENADTSAYIEDEGKINLYRDYGDENLYYERLTGAGKSISKETAEYIIGKALSFEVANYLDEKELTWKYLANGTPFVGAQFEKREGYGFCYQDAVIYISGTLIMDENGVATVNFDYIEEGTGKLKILSALGLGVSNELSTLLEDLGIESMDGVTVTVAKRYTNEEVIGDFITEVGNYVIKVYIPSTETTSHTVLRAYFTRTEGALDLSSYEVGATISGMSEEGAYTYDGNAVDLDGKLYLKDFAYDGVEITLERVISYTDIAGVTRYDVQEIKNAGVYELRVSINVDGYTSETRDIAYYVSRKVVTVGVYFGEENNSEIDYFGTIPEVNYKVENGGIDISELNGLAYATNYNRGAIVGTYRVWLNVTDENLNPNYLVTRGGEATLNVNAVKLAIDESKLQKELTYDGKEYGAQITKDMIIRGTAETNPLQYSLSYTYQGNESDKAFAFKNVGEYNVAVKVISSSSNYLDSEIYVTTVKINHKMITLSAKDAYVNYGEDAVYSMSVKPFDGVDIDENYLDNLVLGTHYRLSSGYVKGVTEAGENLEIGIELLSYTDSDEGKIIGNYIIVGEPEKGTLRVGKKTYALNMVNSYEYSGRGVELNFNGEQFTYSAGYPQYKKVMGGIESDFDGVPCDACDSTFIYRVYIKVDETKEYYGVNVVYKDFIITKKQDNISGLYVNKGGVKVALSDNMSYTYDGTPVRIAIDYNELTNLSAYVITYRYKFYSNDTDTYDYESSNSIEFTDAIKVKEISVILDGGANYESYVSSVEISSFEIAPKALWLVDPPCLTYRGYRFDDEFFTELVNTLAYREGYAPVDGDKVNFTAFVKDGVALNPGTYKVNVEPDNRNYVMYQGDDGDGSFVKQSINSGKAYLNLNDILEQQVFEYGEIRRIGSDRYPYVTVRLNFNLGEEISADIKFFIKCEEWQQVLVPGTYDILSAESIGEGDKEYVSFELSGGQNKVKINPMKITFDYARMKSASEGIKSTYMYSGAVISYPTYFYKSMISSVNGKELTENPDVQVSLDRTFKHAGNYTFIATTNYTAKNDRGEEVHCFEIDESVQTFNSVIEKKEIKYEVAPVKLIVGETLPVTFAVSYPEKGFAPINTDTISLSFIVNGFNSSVEGEYSVEVSIRVQEGGKLYNDYIATKVDPEAKELTVSYLEFDDSLEVRNYTTEYTTAPVEVPVYNLPDGAEVTYSATPTDVGNYSIQASVSKIGYRTKVFSVTLAITQATPHIELTGSKVMQYDIKHTLCHDDVNAIATHNMVKVEGEFSFIKVLGMVPPMKYGEHTYTIEFIPSSPNYRSVHGISYTITTYVRQEDIKVEFDGVELTDKIKGKGEATVSITLPESLIGAAFLIVNGSACLDGKYTFTASEELVLIEVMLENNVLLSKTIDVVIEETDKEPVTPNEPNEPVIPSNPDNNTPVEPNVPNNPSENPSDKKPDTKLGIIIGASVGGGVVIVAIVVVIVIHIKKKGEKNG